MRQYSGGIPNGDAFLVQTPELDQARDRLYQEQKERREFALRQSASLDQDMAKQFAAVRDVDSPEMMDHYNQYKNVMKQVYFDPKLQRDPAALAAKQQEANQHLGKVYQTIEASKQAKQMDNDLSLTYRAHPDRFADDYGDRLKAYRNTPVSQLAQAKVGGQTVDLTNPDAYRYQGSNTDFGALDKVAKGTLAKTVDEDEALPGGLENKRTTYQYGSSPAQYLETMVGQLQKRGAGKDAAAAWDSMQLNNPDVIQHINEEYDKITPQQWKRMTGSEKPQVLTPSNPDNKAEQFAIMHAKAYAVNNAPKVANVQNITNKAAVMTARNNESEKLLARRQQFQAQMSNINNGHHVDIIKMKRSFQEADDAAKAQMIDDTFDNYDKTAEALPAVSLPTTSGSKIEGHPVNVSPLLQSSFTATDPTTGHKVVADQIMLSPDKKNYVGVFTSTDKDGKPVVDASKTITIPASEMKPILRKKLLGAPKTAAKLETPAAAPTSTKKGKALGIDHYKSLF